MFQKVQHWKNLACKKLGISVKKNSTSEEIYWPKFRWKEFIRKDLRNHGEAIHSTSRHSSYTLLLMWNLNSSNTGDLTGRIFSLPIVFFFIFDFLLKVFLLMICHCVQNLAKVLCWFYCKSPCASIISWELQRLDDTIHKHRCSASGTMLFKHRTAIDDHLYKDNWLVVSGSFSKLRHGHNAFPLLPSPSNIY